MLNFLELKFYNIYPYKRGAEKLSALTEDSGDQNSFEQSLRDQFNQEHLRLVWVRTKRIGKEHFSSLSPTESPNPPPVPEMPGPSGPA